MLIEYLTPRICAEGYGAIRCCVGIVQLSQTASFCNNKICGVESKYFPISYILIKRNNNHCLHEVICNVTTFAKRIYIWKDIVYLQEINKIMNNAFEK
jgi:hypothetical protein